MPLQFADRLNNVETSAIRELFKLLGKPGIISFAGGFPDSAMFDVDGIREASNAALTQDPGAALQYGATEGFGPLREQLAHFMGQKGAKDVAAEQLIVTTGSQQALDLIGKTMISPGDKVIVEGPTFLATIQCFRLYGAELISAPVDGHGVKTDELEKLIAEHKPKFVYLIPTFGNPSGALLSAERRKQVLQMAVKHQTLIVEDDPYGDLYFGEAPPPSLLAMSATVPGSRELLVHCGSLSKVLSPGLRVGWMIAPADLLARATMCKQFSDAHTSTFAQATAAQYLKAGRMPATLDKVRAVYAKRAQTMGDALRRVFHHIVIDHTAIDRADQLFGGRLRQRPTLQQGLHHLLHFGVELFRRHHFMDQTQSACALCIDALGRLEETVTLPCTDGAHHIGTDGGGDDAELDFGGGKHRLGRSDGDVARSREARAAAQGRTLHAGDGRLFHLGQHAQHAGQGAGVAQVVVHTVLRGALHPVQVSARRKTLAATGQHDHAHAVVGIQRFACGREFCDQGFVKGVVHIGAVHPHGGNAVFDLDFKGLVHGVHSFTCGTSRIGFRESGH